MCGGTDSSALLCPPHYYLPVAHLSMLPGLVSSSKSSLSYLISRPEGGNVAVIAVGGAPEALDARPGALTLQVSTIHTAFLSMKLKCFPTLYSKSNINQLINLKITIYNQNQN